MVADYLWTCACGQLTAELAGPPIFDFDCHCRAFFTHVTFCSPTMCPNAYDATRLMNISMSISQMLRYTARPPKGPPMSFVFHTPTCDERYTDRSRSDAHFVQTVVSPRHVI